MIFGDYGDMQIDNRMKMAVLIVWCIAVPILSMNLLIAFFSDTYERVFNTREVANISEMVGLILDLELLMIWNRWKMCPCSRKEHKRSHLLYAEKVEDPEDQDPAEIGIG
jgi:hypothetical protein